MSRKHPPPPPSTKLRAGVPSVKSAKRRQVCSNLENQRSVDTNSSQLHQTKRSHRSHRRVSSNRLNNGQNAKPHPESLFMTMTIATHSSLGKKKWGNQSKLSLMMMRSKMMILPLRFSSTACFLRRVAKSMRRLAVGMWIYIISQPLNRLHISSCQPPVNQIHTFTHQTTAIETFA